MTPNLIDEVVEFISNEREPISAFDVAMELVRLGANTRLWTRAEFKEWIHAMVKAKRDGLIVEVDGKLRIKYEEPEAKPKQLGLFE